MHPTKTITPKLNVLDSTFVLLMLPWDVNCRPSINFLFETLLNCVIFCALYGAERPAFQSCLTCWSFSGFRINEKYDTHRVFPARSIFVGLFSKLKH